VLTVSDTLAEIIRAIKARRPAPSGKVNPDGKLLRSFEKNGTQKIAAMLQEVAGDLFDDLSESQITTIMTRINGTATRDKMVAVLAALVGEWALSGAEFGQAQLFGLVGDISVNWALANEAATQWATNYTYELVSGITDTTRDILRREIAGFTESGETFQEFVKRLASRDDLFGAQRAEAIAVTEVTRAYAEGNQVAWRESGVTEAKEWNTANDELVCPICGPLDGKQTPLGDTFDGGHDGPPAHPRCRCWLTPVVIGDLETGQEIFEQYGLERGDFPGFAATGLQ
jgi:SPP1 gp7 family putative phage head morphogenesis protein